MFFIPAPTSQGEGSYSTGFQLWELENKISPILGFEFKVIVQDPIHRNFQQNWSIKREERFRDQNLKRHKTESQLDEWHTTIQAIQSGFYLYLLKEKNHIVAQISLKVIEEGKMEERERGRENKVTRKAANKPLRQK